MKFLVSVLVRTVADSEQGDAANERWYHGEADVPPDVDPTHVFFPNECEAALFPMEFQAVEEATEEAATEATESAPADAQDIQDPAVPEADQPETSPGKVKKGR